jgi:hypothetical protein
MRDRPSLYLVTASERWFLREKLYTAVAMAVPDLNADMGDLQLVFIQYVDKTPSLAGCAKCQVKFFTPQQLMRQPQAAAEYLRDKFARHTCKGEILEEARARTVETRHLRIVKDIDGAPPLGTCEVCNMQFLAPVYFRGFADQAEKEIRRQFDRHRCTRRAAS